MTSPIDLLASVDEHHAAVLSFLPEDFLDLTDIDAARTRIDALLSAAVPELPATVAITERMVPGHDGDPDVRVKVYTPANAPAAAPAMLWMHGGGMVLLSADGDDARCAGIADQHNCVVVSVDYRLAPESPAPALVHDCYASLVWMAGAAPELGIDADRIMIGGASAGGGLAAGTALFARDNGGPNLIGQLLVFPMLDHRNETPSSHRITDPRVWNRDANLRAWEAYLGGAAPTIYSAPATCTDLAGLPPAYINVGSLDMFVDEDVAYAQALLAAGVPCELHVYPNTFHGSSGFLPDHPMLVRWAAEEHAFIATTMGS